MVQLILGVCCVIILGIFWSSQEILWGGLWNWNIIELLILFTGIILSLVLHNKHNVMFICTYTILLICMYIMFGRLQITLNIHSFINNDLYKATNIIILLLLLLSSIRLNFIYFTIFFLWVSPLTLILFKNTDDLFLCKIVVISLLIHYLILKDKDACQLLYNIPSVGVVHTVILFCLYTQKKLYIKSQITTAIHYTIIIATSIFSLLQLNYYILNLNTTHDNKISICNDFYYKTNTSKSYELPSKIKHTLSLKKKNGVFFVNTS